MEDQLKGPWDSACGYRGAILKFSRIKPTTTTVCKYMMILYCFPLFIDYIHRHAFIHSFVHLLIQTSLIECVPTVAMIVTVL